MDNVDHRVEHSPVPDNTAFIRALSACGDAYCERNRENMYRELMQSTLLLPLAPDNTGVMVRQNPKTDEAVMFAFTDPETMTAYHLDKARYVAVPAHEIMGRLSGDEAMELIVCSLESHLPVSHAEICLMADGQIPPPQVTATAVPPSASGEIFFRALDKELPHSVRHILQQIGERSPEIHAVYVFLKREDDGATGYAASVIFSPMPERQAVRAVMDEIAPVITAQLPVAIPVTMFPLERQDAFAREIMQRLPAYYQRQRKS